MTKLGPNYTNEQRGEDAEARTRQLANEAGLRPSGVTRDVHGFDVYVQVPLEDAGRAPELFLAASAPALIQVKGTVGKRVSVHLRVWRKLIEASMPVFFLVYHYPSKSSLDPDGVFLVHLHGALLDAAAKRLWTVDAVGSSSDQTMDLCWSHRDQLSPVSGPRLRQQLMAAIGSSSAYTRTKVAARESAGRGPRPYRLRFRHSAAVEGAAHRELAEFAVGLRAGLSVDTIEHSEERFGLRRALSSGPTGKGLLRWPNDTPPTEPCTLIFIDTESGEETPVRAEVATSSRVFPGLPGDTFLVRVIHEVLEVVIRLEGPETPTATFTFPRPGDTAELRHLALANRIWELLHSGHCEIELRVGVIRHRLPMGDERVTTVLAHSGALAAAAIAQEVARRVGLPDDLRISPADLARSAAWLPDADALLSAASHDIEFAAAVSEPPIDATVALLVVSWLVLGGELVAFHGILYGSATYDPESQSVVVERASSRMLVTRRLAMPQALEETDGCVAEALAKVDAASMGVKLIGGDEARGSWDRFRAQYRDDASGGSV